MMRSALFVLVALFSTVSAIPSQVQAAEAATTVPKVRPKAKGTHYRLKIDSSPQQAAVYWDTGATPAPRDYGIAGYTPIEVKVPKGKVKLILDLKGWKTQERELDVRKSQTITFTMEKQALPGKLDLRAGGDGSAAGASVQIDGVSRGTVPNSFEMTAGRHQLLVTKAGYKDFSDWVDIAEEQWLTRDISLARAELPGGSLLVTSDSGGEVYLDGNRKDAAPAMITGVAPGEHIVEIRKDGVSTWRQAVTVASGQQTKVAANVPVAAATPQAGIRVMANEQDVMVYVDGEAVGKAPVDVKDVRPGQHIVEGRKPHFKGKEEIVKITPGEQLLIRLQLDPTDDKPKGILKVYSAVPGAEVFLDGASLGRAPIERSDLDPGKHFVVVHKDGFVDFKREVILVENKPVLLQADLRNVGALKFLSSPEGAQVFIDGEPVGGKTPTLASEVPAGEHIVQYRLPGYYENKQTVKVEGGRERIVQADLVIIPSGPSTEQILREKGAMTSFGARAIAPKNFTADVGLGYPYTFVGRLSVGVWKQGRMAIDAGVDFRTFFQFSDIGLHGRLQFLELGPLAVAVRGSIGGGAGPNGRNDFYFDITPIASLTFLDKVTFSAFAQLSYWTDKFCPSYADIDNGTTPRDFCKQAMPEYNAAGYQAARDQYFGGESPTSYRDSGARFYAGLTLDVALDRKTTLFVMFQGAPFYPYHDRKAFTDAYNSVMAKNDPVIYGNAGLTFKF